MYHIQCISNLYRVLGLYGIHTSSDGTIHQVVVDRSTYIYFDDRSVTALLSTNSIFHFISFHSTLSDVTSLSLQLQRSDCVKCKREGQVTT